MNRKIRTLKPFRVVGASARTTYALENNPETGKIGELWHRLLDKGAMFRIVHRVNRFEYITVYFDYESDYRGAFTVVLGQRTVTENEVPEELKSFSFPGGSYIVFTASGKEPGIEDKAWDSVHKYFATSSEYARAYIADFEVSGIVPNHVKVFVSVRPKGSA